MRLSFSNSPNDTQTLLNIFVAWCDWSGMTIRLDKCVTFGMRKYDNKFTQYDPALYVNGEQIPTVPSGESFVYLGKIFSFEMKNEGAKIKTSKKLTTLLNITNSLKVKPQWKLEILRRFVHTQLSFELRLYDFGVTWLEQNLDSICYRHVRDWINLPVSSCVKEVTVLPRAQCGLNIPSFREVSERLWLKKRHKFKHNTDPELQQIWSESSHRHIVVDSFLNEDLSANSALINLQEQQKLAAQTHFYSLNTQGLIVKSVTETISRRNIVDWSSLLETMPRYIFCFTRKAILQQLPTASNLHKWKKTDNPVCTLCNMNKVQSNKHVLSNCSAALERYTQRHDNVLSILANWIWTVKSDDQEMFVDLPSDKWDSIDRVFQPTCRPDIVVAEKAKLYVLELTVCHETNLVKSKNYKISKYIAIKSHLQPGFSNYNVQIFTIEISTLGFIGDISLFRKVSKFPKFTKIEKDILMKSVLNDSYNIYRMRNTKT